MGIYFPKSGWKGGFLPNVAPDAPQWDVARGYPRVVDKSILVPFGPMVANPERSKEYWCPCQQVCAWSAVGLKP